MRAGAAAVASDRGGLRSQAVLLALQVGLSVTLLDVTALFGASFARVLNVDRGFTAERVLAVDIALPAARYADEPARQAIYDRLLAAVHSLPGVEGATTTSMLPLRGQGQIDFIAPEGSTLPRSGLPNANFRFVAPEFSGRLASRCSAAARSPTRSAIRSAPRPPSSPHRPPRVCGPARIPSANDSAAASTPSRASRWWAWSAMRA